MKKLICILLLTLGMTHQSYSQMQSRMMIIPADDLLKRLNCLSEKTVLGRTIYERNYEKAYIELIDLRFVTAAIADKMNKAGWPPLDDFELSLKNRQDEEIDEDLRDLQTDAITRVLNKVRPDVILELSYDYRPGKGTNRLTFALVAKDSYTSKIIATITNPGEQTIETDVPTLLSTHVENELNNFSEALKKHADDVVANGRTISLRVSVDGKAEFDLEDDCAATGDPYIDVIMDIVEAKKKPGSPTPNPGNSTSGKAMSISNIKIEYIDPKRNRGVSARDWVRTVASELKKTCKCTVKNVSQGIGDGRMILSN
ncbi:DUF6175 family protein [Dyadobacter sp. CY261]|uniref:DUF6175 family protein n=1 Tax=Dyadobacter sp. CY261 TaxID=2907203 RepID=UPI001F180E0D|nr:DUF6175 family protein [Dyadobacter sp. CY261]MCF0070811.1 DUF6175 family protein [Dyadobacter sp. CY261]